MSLNASYRAAEGIMRERASSFYLAFQGMERSKFLDIAAIYAFCRYADDLADDSCQRGSFVEDDLDRLENKVRSLYDGEELQSWSKHEWWDAFVQTVKTRRIPIVPFLNQIEGQRSDVHFKSVETLEDLIEYCKKVAGMVGLMLAPMLRGQRADERYERICETLGVAMQITNILRDIGEDIRQRKRVYLPRMLMEHYGVSVCKIEDLSKLNRSRGRLKDAVLSVRDLEVPEEVVLLWEELAVLAERYYEEVFENLYMFDSDSLRAVTTAGVYYRAILDEVRKNRYNCFTTRCYTSMKTKKALMKQVGIYVDKHTEEGSQCGKCERAHRG